MYSRIKLQNIEVRLGFYPIFIIMGRNQSNISIQGYQTIEG